MNRTLARVMPHVFKHEGGYADHPHDPGGATNMGVTPATLAAWRGWRVSRAELRALSRAEATAIYRRQYWIPVNGDALPAGVDYAVFDFAIHSGPRRACEYLQRAAGCAADGVVGINTLAAVRAAEPAELVKKLCAARLAYLKRIRHRRSNRRLWTTFGKGWRRRVGEVEAIALQLASTDRAVAKRPVPDGIRANIRRLLAALLNVFIQPWRTS